MGESSVTITQDHTLYSYTDSIPNIEINTHPRLSAKLIYIFLGKQSQEARRLEAVNTYMDRLNLRSSFIQKKIYYFTH